MKLYRNKHLAGLIVLLLHLPGVSITGQELKRPPLTGIAFVELQVSDIKKSTDFYAALLGFTLLPGKAGDDKKVHAFGIAVNGRQLIKLQDGLPAQQDERMLSIAYQTENAEALRVYLQSKAVKVPASVTKEKDGLTWFTVNDPDGHPVKFVEQLANSMAQPKTTGQAISARILHAGVTIASATAAHAFYQDILGFSEIWRGGANDSTTSWINMRVPEGTDYLEYMLVNAAVNRQQLGSLHHIALMVPDMQLALDTLRIRSAAIHYPVASPRVGRNNRWQLNLFDPDGTRIELMEPFTMR
ncbi:MAG: VOC family protein [Chitinophagaceae bacterium]